MKVVLMRFVALGRALGCTLMVSAAPLACSSTDPHPAVTRCAEPTGDGRAVDGAVALGLGDPQTFVAFEDGASVSLIHGPQGGWMITPVIRADQARLGTDGVCAYLDLEADVDGQEPLPLHFRLSELVEQGDYLFTEAIPFLLSFNVTALAGRSCVLSAAWQDDGRSATARASLTLVGP
jgi:hypothetical protein